ncbi:site-specific integrase [Streptomyces viridifaciens]|nr:site-specific integrase [Streptomyces viridifaciens]
MRGEYLPSGRPRQLTLHLDGLRLPNIQPLRKASRAGTASTKARRLPPEFPPEEDQSAEYICTPQVDGQLGLFATPPRFFTMEHAARLRARDIPDLQLVVETLAEISAERGTDAAWRRTTRGLALLALAAREPGERLVHPESLADLPQMRPTIESALDRAGLLAERKHRIVPRSLLFSGSCAHCMAWANDRWKICLPCAAWQQAHPRPRPCSRCRRVLPLSGELCRFCTLVLAETEVDIHGAALEGGDQLWFGGRFAPSRRATYGPGQSCPRRGRFDTRRRAAKAADRAAQPPSQHLAAPGQQALFKAPARDWTRIDEADLPAVTPEAADLIADFNHYIKDRGWTPEQTKSSQRVLRILLAYLGADAPIREADVRSLSSLSSNHQGARVIDYLRRQGLLAEEDAVDAHIARARRIADGLPKPFIHGVNVWIDVLLGQSTKPSIPILPATASRYVKDVSPVLEGWAAAGITSFREITKEHVEEAVKAGDKRARHVGLRSLFRALRRERLIFRDPARAVSLHVSPRMPTPLPPDRLNGLLDKVSSPRDRLILALVAIHALTFADLRRLPLRGLDRARGRLRVIRPGHPDHIVFLDEITLNLATQWVIERDQRWPYTANPHLLVTRVSAASDKNAPVTKITLRAPFHQAGVQARKLREDRILDEAHESADPVHLMRMFGLSQATAIKYIATAHPADIRPDPIAP